MDPIKSVSVSPNANICFDGKCISQTTETGNGARPSPGVVLPSRLTISTAAPQAMPLVPGHWRVRRDGQEVWRDCGASEPFEVPGDSRFGIEVSDTLHHVCQSG